jgi:4-hydroxy-tetrahydrodipicolinate synthase
MSKSIEGIVPVMLTPFSADNQIDYPGLSRLIDWYLEKGVDALFAVCQSSEMQFLTLDERVALAKFVVDKVAGRIPVIASGHISDDIEQQINDRDGENRCGRAGAGDQSPGSEESGQ